MRDPMNRNPLVFNQVASLPSSTMDGRLAFVHDASGNVTLHKWDGSAWSEVDLGGSGGVDVLRQNIPSVNNQASYTVTINSGVTSGGNVIIALVFRNGQLLGAGEYSLVSNTLIVSPIPTDNLEVFTVVLAIQLA